MSTRQYPDLVPVPGQPSEELHALIAARGKLDEQLDALDLQQREAGELHDRASASLAELERAAAAGQQVTKAERTKAENALTQAKVARGEPWAERRAGLLAAARDADALVNQYVVEHLDDLMNELHADADAAAEKFDRACRAVEAAYSERMAVEQRVTSLAAMVRNPRPGDVARTRAEAVVREATALLEAGGEAAPRLVVDPRQPRYTQVEPVGEETGETEQPVPA